MSDALLLASCHFYILERSFPEGETFNVIMLYTREPIYALRKEFLRGATLNLSAEFYKLEKRSFFTLTRYNQI